MKTYRYSLLLATALLPVAAAFAQPNSGKPNAAGGYTVYSGAFEGGKQGKGVYSFHFDPATGTFGTATLAAETDSPEFLALDQTHRFLYVANYINNYLGERAGSISSYAIDAATGDLKFLNRISSRGAGPAHIAVDHTNKVLLVANYQGGSVVSYPINPDGSVGESVSFYQHGAGSVASTDRRSGPRTHEMAVSPDNRFVLVPDLGLDRVMSYRLDPAKTALAPNDPQFVTLKPGSGPRHIVFHPNGRFAYSVNETSSSVTGFAYDAQRGILTMIETLPAIPEDFTAFNQGAEIAMDPAGKFLYASNRGHDSIAVFAIDAAKGMLKPLERVVTGGKTPRYITFDPTGRYMLVAHQNSDNVVLFRFDNRTGHLTPTGASVSLPSPACLVFIEAGK